MPERQADGTDRVGESHYRAIVENSTDLILRFSDEGVLSFVNKPFCQFMQSTSDALIGQSLRNLLTSEEDLAQLERLLGALSPDMQPFTSEHTVVAPTGHVYWHYWTTVAVKASDGQFLEYQAIGRDITDVKRAQETVQQILTVVGSTTGKTFFRRVVDYLCRTCGVEFAFVATVDPERSSKTTTIAVSHLGQTVDNFEYELSGTPCEQVTGEALCHFPTGVQQLFPLDRLLGDMKIDSYMGIPLKSSTGQVLGLIVLLHSKAIPDPEKASAILQVVASRAAAELQHRRDREELTLFRNLVDHSIDGIEVIDPHTGRFLDVNEKACEIHGYSRRELLSLDVCAVDPLLNSQGWESVSRQIRESGYLISEREARRKDGSLFPVEINATFVRLDREYFLAIVRDITERKQTEAAIQVAQERLQLAVQASNLTPFELDMRTNRLHVAPEWKRQLGFRDHEIPDTYEAWLSRVHIDDHEQVIGALRDSLADGQSTFVSEHRLRHKDGSYRWVQSRGVVHRNAENVPIRMVGCHWDITDRKQAEQDAIESERKLAAIAATMPQSLYVFDLTKHENVYANRGVWEDLGYSRDEIVAQGPTFMSQILHPEDLERLPEWNARWETAQDSDVFETEFRARSATGAWRWFLARDTVFQRDQNGRVTQFIGTATDITEHKRQEEQRRALQAQILHAEKLKSLGELAGGIAHDFNNMLTVISSYVSLAEPHLSEESPVRNMIQEIDHASKRAADLTKQMLVYAGRGSYVIQPMRLDLLVEEMSGLLRTMIPDQVNVRLHLDAATIQGDITQMRQVLMNLLKNAADALAESGGEITVWTGVRQAQSEDLSSYFVPETLPAGDYAFVRIEDNGCGMSEETLSRMFDPFFTTKTVGHGLGLAAALGIIRGHQGTVHVTSHPNKGTVTEIMIPQSKGSQNGPHAQANPHFKT